MSFMFDPSIANILQQEDFFGRRRRNVNSESIQTSTGTVGYAPSIAVGDLGRPGASHIEQSKYLGR